MKMHQIGDHILSVFSIGWSLENIDNILGIILLTLNIIRILWSMCYKIYNQIKNKKYKDIENTIKEGTEEIKELSTKGGKYD